MLKVIVTGASRGIGRGIATVLARRGHAVGLLARSEAAIRELQTQIESAGGKAAHAAADLRSWDNTQQAMKTLIARLEGVDVLVNNAGVVTRKPILKYSLDDWHGMIETNIHGMFYATRCVLPTMLEHGRGHVVNISSVSGYMPLPHGAGYAASKHAVTGFSESLMQELRHDGVRVTTIFPGSVDSESHRHDPEADHSWKVQPEEVGEAVAGAIAARPECLLSRIEIRPARPPKR